MSQKVHQFHEVDRCLAKMIDQVLAIQWDLMIIQRPDSKIIAIQSALLGQTFGLLMGVRHWPAIYFLALPYEASNMFEV